MARDTPAQRGRRYSPSESAQSGSPQAGFTTAEDVRSLRSPWAPAHGARDIVLAGCLINYYAK